MIKVVYTDTSLEVSGHANFAKKGKDIVCAAVSAVVQTASSWFKKGDLSIKMDKKNKVAVKYTLKKKTKENKEKLSLIVLQLKVLSRNYKDYIQIRKGR